LSPGHFKEKQKEFDKFIIEERLSDKNSLSPKSIAKKNLAQLSFGATKNSAALRQPSYGVDSPDFATNKKKAPKRVDSELTKFRESNSLESERVRKQALQEQERTRELYSQIA